MKENILHVAFFLDGYTLKKVNDYYRNHHQYHSRIDFRGLKNWVQINAMRLYGEKCESLEMESHYYHPNKDPHIYQRNSEGFAKFEGELKNAGYQVHYNVAGNEGGCTPNMLMMEDALVFASFKKMDVAVVMSTQGNFAALPDRLGMMGVPTIVLGWEFRYNRGPLTVCWKTDRFLKKNCSHYIAMEKEADDDISLGSTPKGWFFQRQNPFRNGRKSARHFCKDTSMSRNGAA